MTNKADHVRIVSLLLGSLLAILPACAESPAFDEKTRLIQDASAAYEAKDWPRAVRLQEQLVRLAPDNATYAYNLACMHAMSGNAEAAVQWLTKAGERGFSDFELANLDSDLENARWHPGYEAATGAIKINQDKMHDRLRTELLKRELLTILPPDYDENVPAPLIVALHGGGGAPQYIVRAWQPVAAQMGAILVAPQALYELNGTFGCNWLKPGDETPDEAEVVVRLAVERTKARYKIDERRTILTGFSLGGFVAHAVGARRPYAFAGVIPMAGLYIREYDNPARPTGDRPPRFYFMCGEHDGNLEQNHLAVQDFTAAGFAVKLRVYPGVGHTFPRDWAQEAREALDFVLDRDAG
jgi:predicted esterase